MNKKDFYNKLKNRQLDECIRILRKEIIEYLVEKIKEKDVNFSYSTTSDLYNTAQKKLEEKYIIMSSILYNLDIMDEREEYVLDELFHIYKELD